MKHRGNGFTVLTSMVIAILGSEGISSSFAFSFFGRPLQSIRSSSQHLSRQTFLRTISNNNEDDKFSGGVFFDGPTNFQTPQQKQQQEQQSPNTNKITTKSTNTNKHAINKDIVIIGAGLAGLSAALHIVTTSSDRHVTILEKEDPSAQKIRTTAGSFAAAGMLAPHSERLPSGPLLDLCLQSREMYTDFVRTVEGLCRGCSEDARRFLWRDGEDESGLEPWEVGFAATGGFLAPAFAGDSVATWAPPAQFSGAAKWLDEVQVRELEPRLHHDVVGGWWFPEDASVDARRLTCSLRAACVERGVQFMYGEGCGVSALELSGGRCKGVHLNDGRILSATSIVLANGSWMRNLLPVPITPHKGQSFSVRMPPNTPPLLSRVLFAQDTYIVPKADGRIVVGATVEAGSFDPNVTPAGMVHCMTNAARLVPALADLPLEETWAGLRPTTPDKGPILGRTDWDNLFLAGGYWRNGVLLAPKTGQLVGDLVLNRGKTLEDPEDEALLEAFAWDRFTKLGGGGALAANSRYAASMHPVHRRSSGVGVAASVGTELGFYSDAGEAAEERKRDRDALFGDLGSGIGGSEEDAFEKAASLGKKDGAVFTYSSEFRKAKSKYVAPNRDLENTDKDDDLVSELSSFEGAHDALTVGVASVQGEEETEASKSVDDNGNDLQSVYESIRVNKAKASRELELNQKTTEERPDPGFRIYYVDPDTRESREVPPFTSPDDMERLIASEKEEEDDGLGSVITNNVNPELPKDESLDESVSDDYNEKTYDGYQTIQQANSRSTREEELSAMRKARMSNRVKTSEIDESKIGVMNLLDRTPLSNSNPPISSSKSQLVVEVNQTEQEDDDGGSEVTKLDDVYATIKKNKLAAAASTEMEERAPDDRPDPGFRIYYVDPDTRQGREVPPYTSPGAFEEQMAEEKRIKEGGDRTDGEAKERPSLGLDSLTQTSDGNGDEIEILSQGEDGTDLTETFDGYQVIQKANGATTREEELAAMRDARMRNRMKATSESSKENITSADAWGE